MENANLDKILADIIANSNLEISNPGFNSMVMNKIMQKEKLKSVLRYVIFCSLLIIAASVVIILLLGPGQSANPLIPPAFDSFSNSMITNMTKAGNWVMGILVFILPVVILLFLKNLIDSGFKHQQVRHS